MGLQLNQKVVGYSPDVHVTTAKKMMADVVVDVGKGNIYLWLVGVQTNPTSVEINMEVHQKTVNIFTT